MKYDEIIKQLKEYNKEDVEKFASYCIRLKLEKNKTGKFKNYWMQNRTSDEMAILFKRVARDGLVLDGKHITIQSTGISYDYIAYKNKMFLVYPDSKIDISLVYKEDKFVFEKENGSVKYSHKIADPFNQKETDILGGYCVIKNKRGESLTLLSKSDIDKHRKVAKTDFIWKQWFVEMALKTIIKKACKLHFSDIFQEIENNDNENYNLENPLDIDIKDKQLIDKIKSIKELKDFYNKNKGKGKDFDKYILIKQKELNENL